MREKPKTVRAPENIAAAAESVCQAASTSIHRRSQQLNIHFGDIIETNFGKRHWYSATQSSIGSGVEAH